jgi:hypothetical protein
LAALLTAGPILSAYRAPGQAGPEGDQLVMGGAFSLASGQTLSGSLVILGGVATLEDGSRVTEDIVILGGTLRADGRVDGDIVSIGGLVDLGPTAVVAGDVNVLSGHLSRAEGTRIEGRVNRGFTGPYSPVSYPARVWAPGVDWGLGSVLTGGLWLIFRSVMWAMFALLAALLFPQHSERVRRAISQRAGVSLGLGALTILVAPLALIIVTITIIGIPVTLAALFLLALGWAFGLAVVGLEVGQRLVIAARQDWAPALSAGLGTFIVTLVGNAIGLVVPCVGWMLPVAVGALGLGAVLITRFGTQDEMAGVLPAPAAPEMIEES